MSPLSPNLRLLTVGVSSIGLGFCAQTYTTELGKQSYSLVSFFSKTLSLLRNLAFQFTSKKLIVIA